MQFEGHELRHEFKYYINDGIYHTLRERFRKAMQPDANMVREDGYIISSLYFEDIYHSALREKVDGMRFRRKYRIRCYDHRDDLIRLECKLKYDNYVSKESAVISRKEYDGILNGDYEFLIDRPENICREFYAFHNSRVLSPAVVVEYLREAYISGPGNVRLTFDKNVAASVFTYDMLGRDYTTIGAMPQDQMIFEVKYDDYMPAFIKSMIQSGTANKCSISKYVMCRKLERRMKQL